MGCEITDGQALAKTTIAALKRIVPERSSVQFDASSSTAGAASSSSSSDGNAGGVSLPVPMEDYRTRQAIDGTSMVRLSTFYLPINTFYLPLSTSHCQSSFHIN